jgi:hypothetical protein
MTDTPAEVLASEVESLFDGGNDGGDARKLADRIRAHIAELERQLAEARAALIASESEALALIRDQRQRAEHCERLLADTCATANEALARAREAESELAAQRERDGRDAVRFRHVITRGKLPLRCTDGYYYEDGLLYPTPDAAIDAALKERP